MKIAFSTLGCPGWSWEDILATAKDLDFDGVEIRGIGSELYVPKAAPFTDENIKNTIERLKRLDLEIPVLTSASYLFDSGRTEQAIKEGRDYIDLASKLGVPFVRVLGDRDPQPGNDVDLDLVAKNLRTLSDHAEGKNVTVLIETNGVLADSSNMAALLEKTGDRNIGVLWDVHHPYRFYGEPAKTTYLRLKDHIRYVHLKDSVIENGKVRYKMMGYGDVPVEAALRLLKDGGYSGYVSLEWVKRWCMELEEPGVVFSHFINHIKSMIG